MRMAKLLKSEAMIAVIASEREARMRSDDGFREAIQGRANVWIASSLSPRNDKKKKAGTAPGLFVCLCRHAPRKLGIQ
jgi:hypothetical protein